jgi:hypothetical protein
VFVLLPFIVKQFYDGVPNDLLELILAVKAAALDQTPPPQSAGTTKSQHRGGTRKRKKKKNQN